MTPRCPKRWHSEVRAFFRRLHDGYKFVEDGERFVFALCEDLHLFWPASETLETEGLTFTTASGQIKAHPAVAISKNAWHLPPQHIVFQLHSDMLK